MDDDDPVLPGESGRNCEFCGRPGELVRGTYMMTLCELHRDSRVIAQSTYAISRFPALANLLRERHQWAGKRLDGRALACMYEQKVADGTLSPESLSAAERAFWAYIHEALG